MRAPTLRVKVTVTDQGHMLSSWPGKTTEENMISSSVEGSDKLCQVSSIGCHWADLRPRLSLH